MIEIENNKKNITSKAKSAFSSLNDIKAHDLRITVLGVGGGGGNTVKHMAQHITTDIKFFCLNTDKQALENCPANVEPFLMGPKTTKGVGSGGDPELGLAAAKESSSDIQALLSDTDICFLATGLGGGTGSGASSQIADTARNMGILTIGVVTTPFKFEGVQRSKIADEYLNKLSGLVDSSIVVSNENLLNFIKQDLTLLEAFELSNNFVLNVVQSISDLIKKPGLINIDFADLCSVLKDAGTGVISSASASGDLRAPTAIEQAMNSPLLGEGLTDKADGIIVNITSGANLKLSEYQVINTYIQQYIREDTKVVMGTSIEDQLEDVLKVTVILTGINSNKSFSDVKSDDGSNFTRKSSRFI